jgi:hypothetical protein
MKYIVHNVRKGDATLYLRMWRKMLGYNNNNKKGKRPLFFSTFFLRAKNED